MKIHFGLENIKRKDHWCGWEDNIKIAYNLEKYTVKT
jgi:hypothetical protein